MNPMNPLNPRTRGPLTYGAPNPPVVRITVNAGGRTLHANGETVEDALENLRVTAAETAEKVIRHTVLPLERIADGRLD